MAKIIDLIEKPLSGVWGEKDETGTGIPVLRTTNFTDNGVIDYTDVVKRSINKEKVLNKFLRKGDIIIEKSGGAPNKPVGRVVYFEGEENRYLFNNFTSVLRVNNPLCDPKYLFYILYFKYKKGYTWAFQNKTTGIANLKLQKFITETEVTIPSMKEQKRRVNSLDKTQEIIDGYKKQLVELDNLIMAVFYELFGDPINNENGWGIKTLKEISKEPLSYGSGASAVDYDGDVRYIRITDINEDGSLNSEIVSPNVIDTKYILNDGDILFARSGATVGKTLRFRESFGKCIYAGYLIKFVPNEEFVLPDYIYYYTKTNFYKRFIESNIKTVAQPNINARQYGELKIVIPPLDLQNKFAEIVAKIEEQKALVKQAITESEHLFNSLMSEYFD